MRCTDDLEVMGWNTSQVELRVHSTSVLVDPEPEIPIASATVYLRANASEIPSHL